MMVDTVSDKLVTSLDIAETLSSEANPSIEGISSEFIASDNSDFVANSPIFKSAIFSSTSNSTSSSEGNSSTNASTSDLV